MSKHPKKPSLPTGSNTRRWRVTVKPPGSTWCRFFHKRGRDQGPATGWHMRFSVTYLGCRVLRDGGIDVGVGAIANDADQCLNGSADERIAACTRAIDS